MAFFARNELRRFLLAQFHAFQQVGFPKQTTFAKNIAAGTLAPAAPTGEDPIMDVVAKWYHDQRQIDRLALARHFLPNGGTEKQQARRIGISTSRLRDRLDSLIRRCALALNDAGMSKPIEPARKAAFA